MQFVQNREIRINNPWESELFGIFAKINGNVVFYFSNRRTLYAFEESQSSPSVLKVASDGIALPLPYYWRLIDTPISSFLLLSEALGIDLADNTLISPIPYSLLTEYRKRIIPEKHFEEDSFSFDEYCISHRGLSGYTCTRHGKRVWDFQGRAYLYTEIVRWRDRIFFGTAGCGGYFYVLDIESGIPIVKIKTGGTSCVEQIGDLCYFLQYNGKTSLVCLNLQSGEIVDRVTLPGKASEHSRIQIIDNKLHAITFRYSGGNLSNAIWNTIQL